jgi:hypothetical protein
MLLCSRSVQGCRQAGAPHRPSPTVCGSVVSPLSRPVVTQASSTPGTGSSSNKGSSQEQIARQQYLSPFSAVDPSVQDASSSKSSQQQDPAENDKWGDVLSVNHTLSSLYIKNFQVSAVSQQQYKHTRAGICIHTLQRV